MSLGLSIKTDHFGEWINGSKAPTSSLKKIKMVFKSFLKIDTNLDVDNYEI
jgi:hypothetical protein